jgi:hypothetical protein
MSMPSFDIDRGVWSIALTTAAQSVFRPSLIDLLPLPQ